MTDFRIYNDTLGKVISENALLANNFFTRLKGLLGKNSLAINEALWISPCNSVHTFFMNFTIDVAFLDEEGYIIEVFPAMGPYRFSKIVKNACSVVEFCEGKLADSGTKPGQRLLLQKCHKGEVKNAKR